MRAGRSCECVLEDSRARPPTSAGAASCSSARRDPMPSHVRAPTHRAWRSAGPRQANRRGRRGRGSRWNGEPDAGRAGLPRPLPSQVRRWGFGDLWCTVRSRTWATHGRTVGRASIAHERTARSSGQHPTDHARLGLRRCIAAGQWASAGHDCATTPTSRTSWQTD
jgi:hypothetical protein